MKRQKVRIERSLLLPVQSARVPAEAKNGDRFRLARRFALNYGLSYEPQIISDTFAMVEHRIDSEWTLIRIPLATEGR